MKRVLLRAPLLTNSGYGVHSRQIFDWLKTKNIDLTVECLNWGKTPWLLKNNSSENTISEIMSFSKSLSPPYDLSIQVQLPDEWNPNLAKRNVGISAFVETSKCNPAWIDQCNKMDMIIVPSDFTKKVILNSGRVNVPINVVHEWYNPDIDKSFKSSDKRYEFKKRFNFLIISQLTAANPNHDRKNIFNTIKWTLEEFKDHDDVGIILKTNMGRGSQKDKLLSEIILKQMVNAFRLEKRPEINLLHGNMTREEIANLYKVKNVKCFISATRGEGYGLPLVDAAAAGVPVVATNWSGHLDFLLKDHFQAVDFTMEKIDKEKVDNRIFLEDFEWAKPDENSFKSQLRYVYENYKESKGKANQLKNKTILNFSREKIKNDYDKILSMDL